MPVSAYWNHPETWWRWLRISLDQLGVRELNAEQHALAEEFVSRMEIKPVTAAIKVAALTHNFETEWTNGRMVVIRSEPRSA